MCHEKNLPQTIQGNQFLLKSTVINIHDLKKLTCAVLSFACETRNDKAFTRK